MKTFIRVIGIICAALLLNACTVIASNPNDSESQNSDTQIVNATSSINTGTDSTTNEPTPEDTTNPQTEYVITFYQDDSTDANGLPVDVRIPHINVSPELDTRINGEIDTIFYERIDQIWNITYEYTVNESYLSLLIIGHEGFGHGGSTLYAINIDLENKAVLSLSQALRQYGYAYSDIVQKYSAKTTTVPTEAQASADNPDADFVIYAFDWTQFYINEENHICLLGDAYVGTHPLSDYSPQQPCVDALLRYDFLWDIADDTRTFYS